MTELEKIQANAHLAVEMLGQICGFEGFGFNAQSVEWVDGYINRLHATGDFSPEKKPGLVSVLGAFLGECIIHTYGGKWTDGEDGWRVQFHGANAAYPFNKVQKQLTEGSEGGESILGFYKCIRPLFFGEKPISPAKPRRSWWRFW